MKKRTLWLGHDATEGDFYVFVTVETSNQDRTNLSISSVAGPKSSGNCVGGAGQHYPDPDEFDEFAPGWDAEKVARLVEVWKRWHLNTMRAGSPRQQTWVRANRYRAQKDEHCSTYGWFKEQLKQAGLDPDTEYLRNGEPYRYGSAWLTEELPARIVEELAALPDGGRKPPTVWR